MRKSRAKRWEVVVEVEYNGLQPGHVVSTHSTRKAAHLALDALIDATAPHSRACYWVVRAVRNDAPSMFSGLSCLAGQQDLFPADGIGATSSAYQTEEHGREAAQEAPAGKDAPQDAATYRAACRSCGGTGGEGLVCAVCDGAGAVSVQPETTPDDYPPELIAGSGWWFAVAGEETGPYATRKEAEQAHRRAKKFDPSKEPSR